MKTVLFSFATPVGTFWIQPQPSDRVLLGIDNNRLKTYKSPTAAAEAVREQQTGFAPWDELAEAPRPMSLQRWKRGA